VTGENRSWKNPAVPDSFREEQARKLAEAEARCRKATKAQKLALARKAEGHKLPGWLEPHRSALLRWSVVAWEGGADEAKEIAHMRVAFGKDGDQVGLNKRKAFYAHLQAFMNYLAQG